MAVLGRPGRISEILKKIQCRGGFGGGGCFGTLVGDKIWNSVSFTYWTVKIIIISVFKNHDND